MNYIDHYVDCSDQSIAAGVSDELSWHADIDSAKTTVYGCLMLGRF